MTKLNLKESRVTYSVVGGILVAALCYFFFLSEPKFPQTTKNTKKIELNNKEYSEEIKNYGLYGTQYYYYTNPANVNIELPRPGKMFEVYTGMMIGSNISLVDYSEYNDNRDLELIVSLNDSDDSEFQARQEIH